MDYSKAVQYIESFVNYERAIEWSYPESFKLDRMKALAKELGNPQNAYDSVIVAGSKGKGSTCAILASILRMENLKVGLYTSPHLLDIRERIRVNGLTISESRFTETAELLARTLDSYEWRKDPPTYFEVLTVMAFHYFKEMKVQVAVLEVGLGGLYDSTNIVPAKVAGITPISLEHTDKLGKTVSKIAVQKCGILKGREIVVSGIQTSDAESVIEKTAQERECELWRVGKEIQIIEREFSPEGQKFDVKAPFGNYFDLSLELLGLHQIANAAQAIGLAKALEKKTRLKISDLSVQKGILDARWPGRLEKAETHPFLILDGAQNKDSAEKLMEALLRHFTYNKLIVLLGVSQDKDLHGILQVLAPETTQLVATRSTHPRALDPLLIREEAAAFGLSAVSVPEVAKALKEARSLAGPEDLILITGSLFLVADIKKELNTIGA